MAESGQIITVGIPRPLDMLFTYRVSGEQAPFAQVGCWVQVPFGRGKTHGFVVEAPKSINELPPGLQLDQLKHVIEVGREGPVISPETMALCQWTHQYYRAPLGEVLAAAVPASVLGLGRKSVAPSGKERKPRKRKAPPALDPPIRFELTESQKHVHEQIKASRAQGTRVVLLEGVTGSGKTEVYLELAREALAKGESVLVLVPEIALTPQLHHRFERALGTRVGLWHSAVADGRRRETWNAVASGELRVLVGARSAIFAPMPELSLIVVDEEHDSTYKQEDRVRYHARDLAIVRASRSTKQPLVILGSATPSMESLARASEGKYGHVRLTERIGSGGMPTLSIVDLSEEPLVEGTRSLLAERTLKELREVLASGQQAMVFLNRRGFAAFLLCQDCGEVTGCPHCSISLTLHKRRRHLRCHICGFEREIPDTCEKCQGMNLEGMGAGTESLEEELSGLIPEAKLLRLDRDQITSQTRLETVLETFRSGKANLMLGTQMLVKGHDFPGVTLVVVMLADALFRWPDFRASERALQILTQVAGRAGRGEVPGRVLIQTYSPDHPVLQVVMGVTPRSEFIQQELEMRKALGYPPFGRIARLRVEHVESGVAKRQADAIAGQVRRAMGDGALEVLGPSEAFIERVQGQYRWDLLLKCQDVGKLQKALGIAKQTPNPDRIFVQIDVDPQVIS